MKRWFAIAFLFLAAGMASRAEGQPTALPEPIVTLELDPPRVAVGQQTTLRIDVLAPNYLASPPELPGFQVRNAVTRPLRSVNLSEQRNGTGYAGVRFEFAIYPQEPGSYAISEQTVKLRYAADPPAVREQTLPLPGVSFTAFIPDGAAALDPYVTASRLTIEQSIQGSSDPLKVGSSVTRSVVIRAGDTPAMLLPQVSFPALDGLIVYPAPPSLEDKTEGRTDALMATRTDAATYILQRPGNYTLPAIDVRWWNAGEGRIATAHLDAVPVQVVAETATASAPNAGLNWRSLVDYIWDHWMETLLGLAGLVVLSCIALRAVPALIARQRRRHASYLSSERFSFGQLQRAARSGDAKASYFALLDWLQRFGPVHSLGGLKAAAADSVLEREVAALEGQLFAGGPTTMIWSSRRFIRHLGSARRRLRKAADRREVRPALPSQMNPDGERILAPQRWRQPAR